MDIRKIKHAKPITKTRITLARAAMSAVPAREWHPIDEWQFPFDPIIKSNGKKKKS